MVNPPLIRPAKATDCTAIAAIYQHYVQHSVATFDETPPAPDDFLQSLRKATDQNLPWWVAEQTGEITGFANANPWKAKSAYRYCAETSIYLHPQACGSGLGKTLYAAFLAALDNSHVRQAIACISLPNSASVALHESLGFAPVGRFSRVGYKFDRWIDVGYWQREASA